MKLKFGFLNILFLLFSHIIIAQVSSDPQYPVATEPVTIYFDATGTALEGYTGDLYAHTGVFLEGLSGWQHVIGQWGDNNTQPKLTRISTDHYKLDITPSINSFYGVADGETVTSINFVFRSADGNTQSTDLSVDVYQDTGQIRILSPDTNSVYSIGDTVDFEAVALFADSIKIYEADTLFAAVDTNTLSVQQIVSVQGKNNFTVVAFNSTDTLTTDSYYFVRKNNIIQDLPAGIDVGITYLSDTSVILCLYAPGKQFMFVKGDFNDWQFSEQYQMNETPDSSYFWIQINGLTPQVEYAYQFNVDGQFDIADPYCDKILDPWNDQYIPESTYPNLKPYPTGKTEGIVSVLETGQTPYNWKIQNFNRPDKKDLIVYELLVRDFTDARNYQALIDTLSYLKNLGINAIELMPVNEFEGNISWGYNPDFYFALDKAYGTKDKFKEFVDSCHSKVIAVIMDMVYNHSYGQSPLVQLYLDRNTWKVTPDNPWYNVDAPNPDYSWGYDFNHESPATKAFVEKNLRYWLAQYNIDGFRFDFSKGFTNTPGNGWAYDQSRINILETYYDTINNVSNGAYLILEHFCENSEEKVLANYGMMLWANLNYAYSQASMGYQDGSDFSWISYLNRAWNNPYAVGYMESHDEERMMYRNLNWSESNGSYDIKDTLTALDRVKLSAALFLTIPGPKMLWQFEELGYDYSIDYCSNGNIDESCRTSEKPVRWDYYENESRNLLFLTIKDLIRLRKELKISNCTDFTIDASSMVKQIVLNNDTSAVIIGNFDVKTQTAEILFPQTGDWYEYYSGDTLNANNDSITLAPGEYRIYTDYKLEAPELPNTPVVSNVKIVGDLNVGDTVSVTYDYSDAENDTEGNTLIQWYSFTNQDGDGKTAIEGATNADLKLTNDLIAKYIACEVTPVAQSIAMPIGKPKMSKIVGPIINAVRTTSIAPNPVITSVQFRFVKDYSRIIVTDVSGKIVDNIDVQGRDMITRDYSNLEAGVYLVKMFSEWSTFEGKFIKWK